MSMSMPLTSRSETILKALIETYLVEGEPVGSRLLAERAAEALSPATIRHVLADLDEEGLLDQPHTSAGRIPTQRAYRYYVDRWILPTRPDPALAPRLEATLDWGDRDVEAWLRHASRVLSEVFQGICVALPLPLHLSRLARLQFVPLGVDRLVAIWVGTGGDVEHQVMANPWRFNEAELVELGNFATHHFSGCTFPELRLRLFHVLQNQADEVRAIGRRLADLAVQWRITESEPPLVVSGLPTLMRAPEFEDAERFRALVEAFEEHGRLARLMNAFAETASADVQLLIGSENPFLGDMPLATAVRTVTLPSADRVAFAVVQPMRVNYARFLGGLAWWSDALRLRFQPPTDPA